VDVGPDLDVVVLEVDAYPTLQPERFDVRARQLEPPRPIEDGELLGEDLVLAFLGDTATA
jgi:hypothetical protein